MTDNTDDTGSGITIDIPSRSPKQWRKHVTNELADHSDESIVTMPLGDLRRLLRVEDDLPTAIYLTKTLTAADIKKGAPARRLVVNIPPDTPYTTEVLSYGVTGDETYTALTVEGVTLNVTESPQKIDAMLSIARRVRRKVAKRRKAFGKR
jgi:hypothetical protein